MSYKALLIDGMNAVHRAAHVARDLTTEIDGVETPIGAVFQFIRIVLHEVERRGAPSCLVFVAWEGDDDGSSWRRALFPRYKANRDPNRHEGALSKQVTILRALLTDLGWSQVWSPGFEADDTLGTLAARLIERGTGPVGIVTGDRDLHQCVTSRVHCIDREVWTLAEVRAKWGVDPCRIPEIKALAGDKSDGFDGIRGIGDKGARELISSFATFEELFTFAREKYDPGAPVNWPPALIRKLVAGEADAALCRRLAVVRTDAPLEFARRARTPAREVFERLRFSSMLSPSMLRASEALAGR